MRLSAGLLFGRIGREVRAVRSFLLGYRCGVSVFHAASYPGWRILDPSPRLPLGDPYYGTCLARPKELFDPPEAVQRDLCNCGYARGRCDHFTDDAAADAVRFSVTGDESGIVRLV